MVFRARTAILAVAGWLGIATAAGAQTPVPPARDSLARALSALSTRLDSLEAGQCPGGPALAVPAPSGADSRSDSLAVTIGRINGRLEALRAARCAS
ncbi:MAG: hypothetical protein H0W67_10270, partial [Gemmatimonadales bacterium]|nr:hypothetical protein [Gemmatimonadales bacterium]